MFSKPSSDVVDKISRQLRDLILKVFNEKVRCILIHGSVIKGGMIEDFSDLDVQVFLDEDSINIYGLELIKSIEMQKLVGNFDLTSIKASYLQMYFYNSNKMPSWYTPPVSGSYQVIFGDLPNNLDYNIENFRKRMIQNLRDLSNKISNLVGNFADSSNRTLLRRVRYLATVIFPSMYSLVSYKLDDPSILWKKPKNEICEMIIADPEKETISKYLKNFFEQLMIFKDKKANLEFLRKTFKIGINVLIEIAEYCKDI